MGATANITAEGAGTVRDVERVRLACVFCDTAAFDGDLDTAERIGWTGIVDLAPGSSDRETNALGVCPDCTGHEPTVLPGGGGSGGGVA